jgi:hypothetical protein
VATRTRRSNGAGKRPFWMHQLVEYLFGGVLVAQGLQSPAPLLPSVAGLLVLLNASTVRGGGLSAFRLVSRSVHRLLDLVVIGTIVVAAVQPWIEVDAGARLVMVAIAVVLAFVWWQSSFAEKVARQARAEAAIAEGDRSVEIGRRAGRLVGDGINLAKRSAANRRK